MRTQTFISTLACIFFVTACGPVSYSVAQDISFGPFTFHDRAFANSASQLVFGTLGFRGGAADLSSAVTGFSPDTGLVNIGFGGNANSFEVGFELSAQNGSGPDLVLFDFGSTSSGHEDPYEIAVRTTDGALSNFVQFSNFAFVNSGPTGGFNQSYYGLPIDLASFGIGESGPLVTSIVFRALPGPNADTLSNGMPQGDPVMVGITNHACPVREFMTMHSNEPPSNQITNLDAELQTRLADFRDRVVGALGVTQVGFAGPFFSVGSGFRDIERQGHLREIRDLFVELDGVEGIEGQGGKGIAPTLIIDPNSLGMICQERVNQVNSESTGHPLQSGPADLGFAPRVSRPDNSLHSEGRAFDLDITDLANRLQNDLGLSEQQAFDRIDELALQAELHRPDPTDPPHFQMTEDQEIQRQAEIRAESPVNILVEDPMGRRVEFDPISLGVVNEIPFAEYSGPGTEPQTIHLPLGDVVLGDYTISGVGTAEGPYSIFAQVWGDVIDPTIDDLVLNNTLASGVAFGGQTIASVSTQLVVPEPSSFCLIVIAGTVLTARLKHSPV